MWLGWLAEKIRSELITVNLSLMLKLSRTGRVSGRKKLKTLDWISIFIQDVVKGRQPMRQLFLQWFALSPSLRAVILLSIERFRLSFRCRTSPRKKMAVECLIRGITTFIAQSPRNLTDNLSLPTLDPNQLHQKCKKSGTKAKGKQCYRWNHFIMSRAFKEWHSDKLNKTAKKNYRGNVTIKSHSPSFK